MDSIITAIINGGSCVALLAYFVYKDNKFTLTITKTLASIDNSLKRRANNE